MLATNSEIHVVNALSPEVQHVMLPWNMATLQKEQLQNKMKECMHAYVRVHMCACVNL